jgi:hypothetical protein
LLLDVSVVYHFHLICFIVSFLFLHSFRCSIRSHPLVYKLT